MTPSLYSVFVALAFLEAMFLITGWTFGTVPRLRVVIQQLFLIRYSIAMMAFLLLFGPVSLKGYPDLLGNLLVLTPMGHGLVAGMSALVAYAAIATGTVAVVNSPRRFAFHETRLDDAPYNLERLGGWLIPISICIGLVLPLFAVVATAAERSDSWGSGFVTDLGCVALGVAAAMAWLAVISLAQCLLLPDDALIPNLFPVDLRSLCHRWRRHAALQPVVDRLAFQLDFLGKGFVTQAAPKRFEAGHLQLGIWAFLGIALYLIEYGIGLSTRYQQWIWDSVPALCFALMIVMMAGFAMTFVAYLFDSYRVPPLFVALCASAAMYTLMSVDHTVPIVRGDGESGASPLVAEVLVGAAFLAAVSCFWWWRRPVMLAAAAVAGLSCVTLISLSWFKPTDDCLDDRVALRSNAPVLRDIGRHWEYPINEPARFLQDGVVKQRTGRTLVVISAAGGGIQAAGWTARS